jgi:hypothetical protein
VQSLVVVGTVPASRPAESCQKVCSSALSLANQQPAPRPFSSPLPTSAVLPLALSLLPNLRTPSPFALPWSEEQEPEPQIRSGSL